MDQKKVIKQLLEFNKLSFNNTYNTMIMLQEQAEKMSETLINHPSLLTEDNKKIIKDWVKIFKDKREQYQDIVNENFDKIDNYIE